MSYSAKWAALSLLQKMPKENFLFQSPTFVECNQCPPPQKKATKLHAASASQGAVQLSAPQYKKICWVEPEQFTVRITINLIRMSWLQQTGNVWANGWVSAVLIIRTFQHKQVLWCLIFLYLFVTLLNLRTTPTNRRKETSEAAGCDRKNERFESVSLDNGNRGLGAC